MLDWQLPIYAAINAELARLDGMRAANIAASIRREEMPYTPDQFFVIAQVLDNLSEQARA